MEENNFGLFLLPKRQIKAESMSDRKFKSLIKDLRTKHFCYDFTSGNKPNKINYYSNTLIAIL